MTYKGIPIRLSADFSAETLQASREWQDIFKVMKGGKKPTTKNTLPRKTLIQTQQRNQKLHRQTKAKRIQHHQTNFAINAKGNFLGKKHKRREQKKKGRGKRPTKQTQNDL